MMNIVIGVPPKTRTVAEIIREIIRYDQQQFIQREQQFTDQAWRAIQNGTSPSTFVAYG